MNVRDTASVLPVVAANDPVDRLASLFDVHHHRLYRLARRLAASADDALDLVQDTFLKAARSVKSIPVGVKDEEAWLVRVLINTRRDQWRKASVRDRHDRTVFQGSLSVRRAGDPEAPLIARTAVWAALDSLPPRRRAIVVMYELEGVGIPQIASLLGISAVTVRWHLSMGRRALTGLLKAYLGDTNEKH